MSLCESLGLTVAGLPGAAARPLLLTAAFFAGPLLYRLADPATARACRTAASAAGFGAAALLGCVLRGDWRGAAAAAAAPFRDANLPTLRNLVVAPVAEEFVFRGCMLPLLRLQVRLWHPGIRSGMLWKAGAVQGEQQ